MVDKTAEFTKNYILVCLCLLTVQKDDDVFLSDYLEKYSYKMFELD